MEPGYHGFNGCAMRYLGVEISKEAQTTFDGNPMSVSQIEYAAIDVTILGKIYEHLLHEIEHWGLENVMILESALVRPYGDAMCENFYLDVKPWMENVNRSQAELDDTLSELYSIMKEHFQTECEDLGFIQKNDAYLFNWRSSPKKKALMKLAYPDIPDTCSTVKEYNTYLEDLYERIDKELVDYNPDILENLQNRNYEKVESLLVTRYTKEMGDIGIFVPKGTHLINFNSTVQTLALFRLIDPKIENSNKETVSKINHPLAKIFRKFAHDSKLVTSYGKNFVDAVAPDGMLRIPKITQILKTGRTSLGLYQLLPGDNKYRNCFVPPVGWKVVGADYASQELLVAATFAEEEAMLSAIRQGHDLHSKSASLLFPDEWKACGGPEVPKGKPDHPDLLKFRGWSKAISFGLMYGKSAVGLAESLDLLASTDDIIEAYPKESEIYIRHLTDEHKELYLAGEMDIEGQAYTDEYEGFVEGNYKNRFSKLSKKMFLKKEHADGKFLPDVVTANDLIDRFYNAYPGVRKFLVEGADQALIDSYIRTPDLFGRIRFFNPPEKTREERAIHRQAMNMPIQASSGNMTKYAICLIKKYIEEHDLDDKVKFYLPIHDEIICVATEEYAEEWSKIQESLMEEAGEVVLGHDLQKSEAEIWDTWSK